MPKVSVVIPNYNHARYLEKRIRSVLDQTFRDFDILILDDCSTDDSRAVVERFLPDERIRIDFNHANSGSTFRQWMKGAEGTRGDYLWIAESDDFSDPRFLEVLVPLLDRNPRAGMAVCASVAVDENGVYDEHHFDSWLSVGVPRESLEVMRRDLVMEGRDYCRKFMVPWTTIPNASAVLFRRQALEDNIAVGLDMKLGGDSMIYCRILKDHDIARSAEMLNYFRQHGRNVRSKVKPALFVSESLNIQTYIFRTFGRGTLPESTWRFFTQLLIGGARRPPSNKVPFKQAPRLLFEALTINVRLFRYTAAVLCKEALAELIWRFCGRTRRWL